MNKFKIHFRTHWHFYFLAIIVLVSSLIHFWKFDANLLFRADQSRDAYYAKEVFDNGLKSLRLLGPKVDLAYIDGDLNPRGETLHLGPFYYYLQTFFVFIFNNVQPWVIALPDTLMFIFAIPLFYYFNIQFFSKKNSLLITALFAFSFFNLMYSKFNWNPNQLFFWEILLVLSLFKLVNLKDEKKGRWLLFFVLSLLVISQLHFVAFTGFALLSFCFLFFFPFSKISFKFWLASLLLVLVFNLPMIISEVKNDGDNSKRFLSAITREQKEIKTFSKKVSKTYDKFGEFFAFSLTSFNEKEISFVEKAGGLFFVISIVFIFFLLLKNKTLVFVENQKIFSWIVLLWAACFFLTFFRIYNKLNNERYFVAISPLVFLILGVWFSLLEKIKIKSLGNFLVVVFTAFLLFFNFQATYSWYAALHGNNQEKETTYSRNLKLGPHDELITFGQMSDAFDYIARQAEVQNKKVCLRNSNYQYNLGFEFIRDTNYPDIIFSRFSSTDNYSDCLYFIVGRTLKGEKDIEEEFLVNFKIKDSKRFNALIVWELSPINESAGKNKGMEIEEKETVLRAEKWGDLFGNPPYNK